MHVFYGHKITKVIHISNLGTTNIEYFILDMVI